MPSAASDDVSAWRAALREAKALDTPTPARAPGAGLAQSELVIDARTGAARQAGSAPAQRGMLSAELLRWRTAYERSLFAFARGVLGKRFLTAGFHREGCQFIQRVPPFRKLLMWPREHGKSAILSDTVPVHMLIQPADANVYFPTELDGRVLHEPIGGEDTRIVLTCETLDRGKDHMRVVQEAFESNKRLRALWPHRTWDAPRRQSKKWNDVEMILPRTQEWADPSLRVIGVGGALAGMHPIALLKDDMISLAASNSPALMTEAKRWHVTSRALINKSWALEMTNGTHWAVGDVYDDIKRDPTVECVVRSIIEGGAPLWPEEFPLARIAQLEVEFGAMFPLLYMNSTVDPALVDFNTALVRESALAGGTIALAEDERDEALRRALTPDADVPRSGNLRRKPLSALWEEGTPRDRYVRLKYG